MKKRISSLSILQTAKFLGMLYGLLALVFVPFILLAAMFGKGSIMAILPMLLLYPIMGFIGGIVGAFLYNFVAKIVGGIEFMLDDIDA